MSVHCDVDMAETQLFSKPPDKDEENEKENFDPTEKVNFPFIATESNSKQLYLQSDDKENDNEDLAPTAMDQLFKIPEMSAKRGTKVNIFLNFYK